MKITEKFKKMKPTGHLDFLSKEGWGGHMEKPLEAGRQQALVWVFLVLLFASFLVGGFYFWRSAEQVKNEALEVKKLDNHNPWYAIKLVDGEIIYGRIADLNTEPLEINPVYYNYDQKKIEKDSGVKPKVNETIDLRLVRRGSETHGPDGALKVFRAQVVYMENLRPDSKVLGVIEENEKK
jgi:hypothetical protein